MNTEHSIQKTKKMCVVYHVNWDTEEAGICLEGACTLVSLEINPVTQDAYVYPVTVKIEGVADIRYFSFWDGHWHNQGSLEMDDMVTAWKERPDPYNPLWGQNCI